MLNAIYVFGTIGRKQHRLLVRLVPRLLGDVVEHVGRYNIHYLFSASARALTDISTLCLKKVPTFYLSVTLSNLNRFSKFWHGWKA